jgi:hypothetical protein
MRRLRCRSRRIRMVRRSPDLRTNTSCRPRPRSR